MFLAPATQFNDNSAILRQLRYDFFFFFDAWKERNVATKPSSNKHQSRFGFKDTQQIEMSD